MLITHFLPALLTSKIVNSYQEDQRPSGAGYDDGAEAPVANPGSGEYRGKRECCLRFQTPLIVGWNSIFWRKP